MCAAFIQSEMPVVLECTKTTYRDPLAICLTYCMSGWIIREDLGKEISLSLFILLPLCLSASLIFLSPSVPSSPVSIFPFFFFFFTLMGSHQPSPASFGLHLPPLLSLSLQFLRGPHIWFLSWLLLLLFPIDLSHRSAASSFFSLFPSLSELYVSRLSGSPEISLPL